MIVRQKSRNLPVANSLGIVLRGTPTSSTWRSTARRETKMLRSARTTSERRSTQRLDPYSYHLDPKLHRHSLKSHHRWSVWTWPKPQIQPLHPFYRLHSNFLFSLCCELLTVCIRNGQAGSDPSFPSWRNPAPSFPALLSIAQLFHSLDFSFQLEASDHMWVLPRVVLVPMKNAQFSRLTSGKHQDL